MKDAIAGTIVVLASLAAGCTELALMPEGSCGNGVLDPATEDCDYTVPAGLEEGQCGAPSDPARACRLICDSHTACPAGWRCAVDGACVHGTSQLVDGPGVDTTFDEWNLGDVDGDGLVDVVGLRGGELELRHGEGGGRFGEAQVRFVDVLDGVSIRDADRDGILDVAVPTPAGVVVFTGDAARDIGLRPLAYKPSAFDLGLTVAHAWVLPADLPPAYPGADGNAGCQGAVVMASNALTSGLAGRTYAVPSNTPEPLPFTIDEQACSSEQTDDCMGRQAVGLPRLPATAPSDGMSFVIAPPGLDRVLLVTPVLDTALFAGQLWGRVEKLLLPLDFAVSPGGAALAIDANGDGVLDVHIPACSPKIGRRVLLAPRDASGNLGAFAPASDPSLDLGTEACGADELGGRALLAAGDVNADGSADYVLSDGLLLSQSGKSSELVRAELPIAAAWDDAVVADFDGNGLLDVAAARRDATRIDVLYTTECQTTCSTVSAPWDLAGKAKLLRAGQFDGLGGSDLAFVVSGGTRDRVEVAFGESAGLLAPETMAALSEVRRLEAGSHRNDPGACDSAVDIALTHGGGQSGPGLVVLLGSARRALYAPLVLGLKGATDTPLSVVLASSGQVGRPWLLAQADSTTGKAVHAASDVLVDGAVKTVAGALSTAALCSQSPPSSTLVWRAADLDGDGAEEAIGIERRCATAPESATTRLVTVKRGPAISERALPGEAWELRDALVDTLDADQYPDLVLAGAEGVRIWWGEEGGWAAAPTDLSLFDARALALLDADWRQGRELAVLVADKIVVLTFADRNATALAETPTSPGASSIRSHDVDHDGVDDVVVAEADRLRILLGQPHRAVGGAKP